MIEVAITAWRQLDLNADPTRAFSKISTPLPTLKHFLSDLNPTHWTAVHMLQVEQIVQQNLLFPFCSLQQNYAPPQREIFTYLRIRSLWRRLKFSASINIPTQIHNHLSNTSNKTKGISPIYLYLLGDHKETKLKSMLK